MDDGCSRLCILLNAGTKFSLSNFINENSGLLLTLLALLFFSAFFSSSETAITAPSKVRIKAMADGGNKAAKVAFKLMDNFDRSITDILVGNNIVNLAMGSISTILAIHAGISPTVITICITATVILFGEVIPKAIAKETSEAYTLKIAVPLKFISLVLTPISVIFALISKGLTKLFAKEEPSVTEDDVIEIIEDMEEEGSIDSDESRLLYSAFEFDDVSVIDILTDRRDMLCLDVELSDEEILDVIKNSPYSRLPVYKGNIDNCIGVLRIREYLECYFRGEKPELRKLLDTPLFVSPDTKIDELLSVMKRIRKPFALVKTRSNRIIGLVTMEDMLEELVGEIWDENDKIEDKFRQLDETTFIISADLSVVSAFEMMDYDDFDRDECGHYTLRKWMGRLLGRVATVGATAEYRRLEITAEKVFRGRLVSLKFKINPPAITEESEVEE